MIVAWANVQATIGLRFRNGPGKTCHIETAGLWIQNFVHRGECELTTVEGERDPADTMTKASISGHIGASSSRFGHHLVQSVGKSFSGSRPEGRGAGSEATFPRRHIASYSPFLWHAQQRASELAVAGSRRNIVLTMCVCVRVCDSITRFGIRRSCWELVRPQLAPAAEHGCSHCTAIVSAVEWFRG